jgi:hypothetical protein
VDTYNKQILDQPFKEILDVGAWKEPQRTTLVDEKI